MFTHVILKYSYTSKMQDIPLAIHQDVIGTLDNRVRLVTYCPPISRGR